MVLRNVPALTFVEPVFVLVPLRVSNEPVPIFSKDVEPIRLPKKVPEVTNNVPTVETVPLVNTPIWPSLENCVVPEPLRLESDTVPLVAENLSCASFTTAPDNANPVWLNSRLPPLTAVCPV